MPSASSRPGVRTPVARTIARARSSPAFVSATTRVRALEAEQLDALDEAAAVRHARAHERAGDVAGVDPARLAAPRRRRRSCRRAGGRSGARAPWRRARRSARRARRRCDLGAREVPALGPREVEEAGLVERHVDPAVAQRAVAAPAVDGAVGRLGVVVHDPHDAARPGRRAGRDDVALDERDLDAARGELEERGGADDAAAGDDDVDAIRHGSSPRGPRWRGRSRRAASSESRISPARTAVFESSDDDRPCESWQAPWT